MIARAIHTMKTPHEITARLEALALDGRWLAGATGIPEDAVSRELEPGSKVVNLAHRRAILEALETEERGRAILASHESQGRPEMSETLRGSEGMREDARAFQELLREDLSFRAAVGSCRRKHWLPEATGREGR